MKRNELPHAPGIYRWTCPKGRTYVGQAVDIKNRAYTHGSASSGSSIAGNVSKKYRGLLDFEVLELCSISELNDREPYWIKKERESNPGKVLNRDEGGRQKDGGVDSVTVYAFNISTGEELRFDSILSTGWALFDSNCAGHISEAISGKRLTYKGFRFRREDEAYSVGGGENPATPKKVRNVDTGTVFNSVTAAARSVGTSQPALSYSLRKGGGLHKGCRWEFI